ncbi:hypothetical protein B0I35DRAFT_402008 [Stachybotrys elegans]|uniref:Tyrosinase copper-binding domain-containing protein n=1 Tax=Stachybotrys elegans TaxID=80388 RepID=A0A8K0S985_9HYPO|nr:hypothetical protein B0I35DRAFT_402008 [Stachybotrys elegans]
MRFLSVLVATGAVSPVAAGVIAASASLSIDKSEACINPPKRVEWRQLEASQQQSYIDAVLCLKTKPSRTGLETSLYDDFPHVHFNLNKYIHGGAPFLPWHRYFGYVYLNALRECGYTGPGTYWDWSLDTAGLRHSPVMSDVNGFGGDGSSTRTETSQDGRTIRCVDSGPFSNLRPEYLAIDPVTMVGGGHCLWRNLPEVSEPEAFETMSKFFGPDSLAELHTAGNWTSFAGGLEGGPHGLIHACLGGDMNPTTSPNEPLFFLHHAQVDRLWWLWQQEDESRLSEYNGKAIHYNQTEATEVSLDDILMMGGLADDLTVRDVMSTQNGPLCYAY